MKLPGPKTLYAAAASAVVLLLVAAALVASGIDTGRPKATDLPLLVARSTQRPVAPSAVAVPVAPPATAPAPAPQQSVSSGGSNAHSPAVSFAKPAAAAAPVAPASPPDHEVVVPPVRENDEHRTSAPTTGTHD